MENEKKYLLSKVHGLINERKEAILEKLPNVHEIDDGIIVRFFTKWDNCEDDDEIKFKRIVNQDNPDESIVFFYLPKGSKFELKQRFYIGCMTCLSGKMEVIANNKTRMLNGYTKLCVESAEVDGIAFENTYLITSSNRNVWSRETLEHVKATHG